MLYVIISGLIMLIGILSYEIYLGIKSSFLNTSQTVLHD